MNLGQLLVVLTVIAVGFPLAGLVIYARRNYQRSAAYSMRPGVIGRMRRGEQ